MCRACPLESTSAVQQAADLGVEYGDEQAGDADPVADMRAAAGAPSAKQHPPEQQACEKEADVLQAVCEPILEHQPIERGRVPQPECKTMKRRRRHGMTDRAPTGGDQPCR